MYQVQILSSTIQAPHKLTCGLHAMPQDIFNHRGRQFEEGENFCLARTAEELGQGVVLHVNWTEWGCHNSWVVGDLTQGRIVSACKKGVGGKDHTRACPSG